MQAKKPVTYWVGVDEAGYGPNLGPLVMTAIVARSANDTQPDIWKDVIRVSRARPLASGAKLIIDDSKAVMARANGLAWLEKAFVSIAATINQDRKLTDSSQWWTESFGPDVYGGNELKTWQDEPVGLRMPSDESAELLKCRKWKVCAAQVRVVGPLEFNELLGDPPNKSTAHGLIFRDLMRWLQTQVAAGDNLRIVSDKHAGRKHYNDLIMDCFPGCWVHKETEKQELSRYRIQTAELVAEIEFKVQADAANGLVALASMVSKYIRERWMEEFNAWFASRVPGIRPTAGYPLDAKRFAEDIRDFCKKTNLARETWWRLR